MSEILEIRKVNDVHAQILCEEAVASELSDRFTFAVPNARFSPAFKNKWWDGKIRLFNRMTHQLPMGLIPQVVQYAQTREYTVSYALPSDFEPCEFSVEEARNFIVTLNLPEKYEIREYQLEAFIDAIRRRRALQVCPTASGKSLIMYLILMYYINVKRLKTNLVIVPTIGLVKQLTSDFKEYGCPYEIQEVYYGQDTIHKPIIVTTWQSAKDFPKDWFTPFDLIIGDEAHTFKAKSLIKIMDSMPNCMHRIGLTGTLDGSTTNKLVLEGMFGTVRQFTTTKQLQEQGYIATLLIKVITLSYSPEDREIVKKAKDYNFELSFLLAHLKRNRFIRNLALSLEGNTLVLFRHKDHGRALYETIKAHAKNRNVYFVDGDVEVDVRETMRKTLETEKNAIAVVSYGTFSTGINIVNLSNAIFAAPSKQRIRVLQSIGRTLRKSTDKTVATLYDIVDDLSWRGRTIVHYNYMLQHFKERLSIYASEQFPYKIYTVGLE